MALRLAGAAICGSDGEFFATRFMKNCRELRDGSRDVGADGSIALNAPPQLIDEQGGQFSKLRLR